MSISAFHFSGKRRLITVVLAALALIALIAVVAFNVFHTRTAYGEGVGLGLCSPHAPVCVENGNSAYAEFTSVSNDGCITTDVAVQPMSTLTNPGRTLNNAVTVFISKYDLCNDVQVELGSSFDPTTGNPDFTGTVQFGANLSTAEVNGTAPLYDVVTGAFLFDATIDVVWQGYGDTIRNLDNEHFKAPGITMNLNIVGTSRYANVSGTFTDETGANVATTPAPVSALLDSHGAQVIISRP